MPESAESKPDIAGGHAIAALLGVTPEKLRQHVKLAHWLSISFVILGVAAIILPGLFTLGIELFLGWLLLIAGVLQAIGGFSHLGSKGGWIQLLVGLLSAVVGVLFLLNPFQAVQVLTMFLAALFITNGIFRMIYAFQVFEAPGSGLAIINGIFGIIIGGIVWWEWPTSAVWFIGLIVGIDMLFCGLTLFALVSAVKKESQAS